MKKHVKNNVYWVGHIDWELTSFHGDDYSINNGSSQNAYLIKEEKTVLMDTVWIEHEDSFVANLKKEIDLADIDFIVVNHAEIDHSGALATLMEEIPDTPIYCSQNALSSIKGQHGDRGWDLRVVKTGDRIDIGNGKELIFVEMRMLHWPDSMATYMTGDNILFSNDAFGQHFAVEELFNDRADQCKLNAEAMKYFANILNPFAPILTKKLEEILGLGLEIDMIATSHGAIWRDNPMQIVEKYQEWADAYQEDQITIIYDTMWENTTMLAHEIAGRISELSPDTVVKVMRISKDDKNDIMTEVFKSKAIAVGSPTVSNSILSGVAGWLEFLKQLKFKNKKAAAFGSYGWSGESVKILEDKLSDAGFDVIDSSINCQWTPTDEDLAKVQDLVEGLVD